MTATIHIAGTDIQIGSQLRQRCAWCGTVLLDYALDRIAVPTGQAPRPGTWPIGDLVACDGSAQYVIDPAGDRLPDGCCGTLDPEVTR